jgi:type I pantothenate kinase
MEPTGVAMVAELLVARGARLVAVTGGVAAGKSTFAAALADALPGTVAVVATDGFLHANDELAARGLSDRKGFPESFDADALGRFLDAVAAGDATAAAPVYSHLAYDVVPGQRLAVGGADVVIVEGLHLASPVLGVRSRFDLVVHLDADDGDLERWYLERFRTLRTAAAADPAAFLHPYLSMGGDALDAMALDVWRAVNLAVLHEHARPDAVHADLVLHLDADHGVERTTSN